MSIRNKKIKRSVGKTPQKIGIIGLGPVGMILAVHLQEAGCEVVLCDIDKIKINLVRREGLRLEGVINKQAPFKNICTSISELAGHDPDLLIFSLKTHQMPRVVKEAAMLKNGKLCVLSAQNGIDVEQILAAVFGESQTLRMVLNFAGNLQAPNVVKVTFFNPPNYIASIDDSQEKTAKFFGAWLNEVKLQTEVVDSFEILKRSWEKTILNSSLSALCGVGKFTMAEAMAMPDTIQLIERVIEEAVEVAKAKKIKFGVGFIKKCLRYLKNAGDHFPSLAVDLINNRETEIDYFNGKIVEYGKKHRIETPLNLTFTSLVKAITQKQLLYQPVSNNNLPYKGESGLNIFKENKKNTPSKARHCFMGIDLGSAYTKFTVIDDSGKIIYQHALQTLNREKIALKHVLQMIQSDFPVKYSCATGYGRKHFPDADIIKTEINCAAAGAAKHYSGVKNIIDIGGEDIKVIKCDERDQVDSFYLNDKCAAGTGAFITEIAERAEITTREMSDLASKSDFKKELNSFCTVFAKTEIMGWLFDGVPIEDISKGIYISIANRVAKLRVDTAVPVYMIGGVIAHHPHLKKLLEEKFQNEVHIVENPQYITSLGAAIIAKNIFNKQLKNKKVLNL
ncbi:MAG: 2-dehydropantoate 2-reductase [Cytophagales bacterium]|nr:2-dehydropantoate 2-reductase [Cytophagales bacterium]